MRARLDGAHCPGSAQTAPIHQRGRIDAAGWGMGGEGARPAPRGRCSRPPSVRLLPRARGLRCVLHSALGSDHRSDHVAQSSDQSHSGDAMPGRRKLFPTAMPSFQSQPQKHCLRHLHRILPPLHPPHTLAQAILCPGTMGTMSAMGTGFVASANTRLCNPPGCSIPLFLSAVQLCTKPPALLPQVPIISCRTASAECAHMRSASAHIVGVSHRGSPLPASSKSAMQHNFQVQCCRSAFPVMSAPQLQFRQCCCRSLLRPCRHAPVLPAAAFSRQGSILASSAHLPGTSLQTAWTEHRYGPAPSRNLPPSLHGLHAAPLSATISGIDPLRRVPRLTRFSPVRATSRGAQQSTFQAWLRHRPSPSQAPPPLPQALLVVCTAIALSVATVDLLWRIPRPASLRGRAVVLVAYSAACAALVWFREKVMQFLFAHGQPWETAGRLVLLMVGSVALVQGAWEALVALWALALAASRLAMSALGFSPGQDGGSGGPTLADRERGQKQKSSGKPGSRRAERPKAGAPLVRRGSYLDRLLQWILLLWRPPPQAPGADASSGQAKGGAGTAADVGQASLRPSGGAGGGADMVSGTSTAEDTANKAVEPEVGPESVDQVKDKASPSSDSATASQSTKDVAESETVRPSAVAYEAYKKAGGQSAAGSQNEAEAAKVAGAPPQRYALWWKRQPERNADCVVPSVYYSNLAAAIMSRIHQACILDLPIPESEVLKVYQYWKQGAQAPEDLGKNTAARCYTAAVRTAMKAYTSKSSAPPLRPTEGPNFLVGMAEYLRIPEAAAYREFLAALLAFLRQEILSIHASLEEDRLFALCEIANFMKVVVWLPPPPFSEDVQAMGQGLKYKLSLNARLKINKELCSYAAEQDEREVIAALLGLYP